MSKLAYEALMPASTFNDSNSCLGQVRQMLSAMREHLREIDPLEGQLSLSILVVTDVSEQVSVPQQIVATH